MYNTSIQMFFVELTKNKSVQDKIKTFNEYLLSTEKKIDVNKKQKITEYSDLLINLNSKINLKK